jgi:hypothetical protein
MARPCLKNYSIKSLFLFLVPKKWKRHWIKRVKTNCDVAHRKYPDAVREKELILSAIRLAATVRAAIFYSFNFISLKTIDPGLLPFNRKLSILLTVKWGLSVFLVVSFFYFSSLYNGSFIRNKLHGNAPRKYF